MMLDNTLARRKSLLAILSELCSNLFVSGHKRTTRREAVPQDLLFGWNGSPEGYYTFGLFNDAGEKVFAKDLWMDGDEQVLNFPVQIPHGIYRLEVISQLTGSRYLSANISM